MKNFVLLIFVLLSVTACNTVPPTNVHQPMTARPAPRSRVLPAMAASTSPERPVPCSRTGVPVTWATR